MTEQDHCVSEGASVTVRDLSFSYKSAEGRVDAIQGITFSIEKGDIYTIIGPSASGKSTLLYILAGLLPFASGEALINGEKPRAGKTRHIAYSAELWASPLENGLAECCAGDGDPAASLFGNPCPG